MGPLSSVAFTICAYPKPHPSGHASASGRSLTQSSRSLHADTVSYRTQELAAFPRGSAKWNQFDSLPTTTEGEKQKAEGTGQDTGGGGDPAPPPS